MDDISSLESLFEDENHFRELYQLVVRGGTTELKSRLEELSNPMEYLIRLRRYGEEQLTLLMTAALHGHDEIVRLLLTYDHSDEQLKSRGKMLNEDHTIMNAVNALYCACYRGHFHVAKTLIELGKADVHSDSSGHPYYPLLEYATVHNRLDIVWFLVENWYADVNKTKYHLSPHVTILIHAVYLGNTALVQYLLDAGADVSYFFPGLFVRVGTALMGTVRTNNFELFVLLHRHGAKIDDELVEMAVDYECHSVVRYLLDKSLFTPDQLELAMACSRCVPAQTEVLRKMIWLLRISLEYRQRTGHSKVLSPPLSIYDYQQECQTVDELDGIVNDHDRMLIEFLLIHDRLRSHDHRSIIIQLLNEYTGMMVAEGRFDLCFDLCHYIFDLIDAYGEDPTLHRFIWLMCEMLSRDHRLPVDRFLRAAHLIFRTPYEISRDTLPIDALFMVVLATKVTFSNAFVTFSTNSSQI
jgi:ankyrin repeat protein